MKVSGYKLREALRRWQLRRDTAAGQFSKVLLAFPDEKKPTAYEIAAQVLVAEMAIANLQAVQSYYNSNVRVTVGTLDLMLLECIKRIGGLGRVEKMWRTAATVKEERYALHDSRTRKTDEVVAERTVSYETAGKNAAELGQKLGAYREAIAIGNASEVDIPNFDATLLE